MRGKKRKHLVSWWDCCQLTVVAVVYVEQSTTMNSVRSTTEFARFLVDYFTERWNGLRSAASSIHFSEFPDGFCSLLFSMLHIRPFKRWASVMVSPFLLCCCGGVTDTNSPVGRGVPAISLSNIYLEKQGRANMIPTCVSDQEQPQPGQWSGPSQTASSYSVTWPSLRILTEGCRTVLSSQTSLYTTPSRTFRCLCC